MTPARAFSLRHYLLAGILLPVALFIVIDTVSLYRRATASINTAYDRSLLFSARAIAELLTLDDSGLHVELPSAPLEIIDNDETRMAYRVSGFSGEFMAGNADLPIYAGTLPQRSAYAALVDFYDVDYRGEPVRMAALYQPVAGATNRGVALVQVAETLEVRRRLTRQILIETLLRQALLLGVIGAITGWVVTRALKPLDALRAQLGARDERDLTPIESRGLPKELGPVLGAANDLMARLQRLIEHQRQFVRDASHQLRTPLAVLKTQVQNARRGPAEDVPAALRGIDGTVDRAVRLANQMLALAKVGQVQAQEAPERVDLAALAQEVALDLSPLIGDKALDFELRAVPAGVLGQAWNLRELIRNLLHNAIRETPAGGSLLLAVAREAGRVELLVSDSGPGLAPAMRERLFEPFHTGHPTQGSGLGLSICREICQALGARIELVNREEHGRVLGLDARVNFAVALEQ